MKSLPAIFISTFICAVTIAGFLYYSEIIPQDSMIRSPIPESLTRVFYPSFKNSGYWQPVNTEFKKSGLQRPEINAKAALSYDLTENKMLYAKNLNEKLPIASLTKVMTAIVALENQKESDVITVSKSAASIGEDSMGLSEGEKIELKYLLYGLFLQSGNDAAEAIAQSSKFGREDFIHLMNKKAEDLGLSKTHFTNPTGLEGDGNQYSTVHDLLIVTRYALEKPSIKEVAQTYAYSIPYTSTHKAFDLYNETNLLTSYPGVKGVKTGYTEEAGLCLITYLEYNGHSIIAIVLNSPSRRDEMIKILDYSLKLVGITPPKH